MAELISSRADPSLNIPVAVNSCVCPGFSVGSAGVTSMPVSTERPDGRLQPQQRQKKTRHAGGAALDYAIWFHWISPDRHTVKLDYRTICGLPPFLSTIRYTPEVSGALAILNLRNETGRKSAGSRCTPGLTCGFGAGVPIGRWAGRLGNGRGRPRRIPASRRRRCTSRTKCPHHGIPAQWHSIRRARDHCARIRATRARTGQPPVRPGHWRAAAGQPEVRCRVRR